MFSSRVGTSRARNKIRARVGSKARVMARTKVRFKARVWSRRSGMDLGPGLG